MSSNTLDELGRSVLEAVEGQRIAVGTLESELDADRAEIDDRLGQLVDNGLIREVGGDAEPADGDADYELTENGLRLLNSTPVGAHDNRIDTPTAVDRAIEDFDLRPDVEAAVRNAFSFLRYWGDATAAEITDAAYSEAPAGHETAERWWEDCVRERLAALPDVHTSSDEPLAETERWVYDGVAVVEQPDDEDGRAIGDEGEAPSSFGSARHAIERSAQGDDRPAARAAFATLVDRGRATTDELLAAVDADRPVDDDSAGAPSERLAAWLDPIPGVDRETSGDGEVVWVYDSSNEDDSS